MRFVLLILIHVFGVSAMNSQKLNTDSLIKTIQVFQKELNSFYRDSIESPLGKDLAFKFKGHEFYPADVKYCVKARLKRTPGEAPFKMATTKSITKDYVKYGEITFTVKGKKLKLNVYQSLDLMKTEKYKNYLFLPFKDLTSGNGSYGGGRYIDLLTTDSDTILVDFNKAYNPYCAYSDQYYCPIPPKENFLDVEIKAGLKAPADH
jgi:uncharacterized protein